MSPTIVNVNRFSANGNPQVELNTVKPDSSSG